MTSTIKVDTISENTSANGVAVDGVTLKDGAVGAAGTATSVAGIPFYSADNSIYTYDVSGTDNTASFNTAYGIGALGAITDGDQSVAIGYGAGDATTTGRVLAIGKDAAGANTTGGAIIAIGDTAYDAADTENYNIAIGTDALGGAVAGGEYNVAVGHFSLDALTSGDNNVAVGYEAGTSITSANGNVLVGYRAGENITENGYNVLVGSNAGEAITTGTRNIMLGQAGNEFDAENDNIGIGHGALGGAVAGGEYNVAIGNFTLDALTSGDQNTVMGHNAGTRVTTASYNTMVGVEAGANVLAGGESVYVGFQAGANVTSGIKNIVIGSEAGLAASPSGNLTTENHHLCLGNNTLTNAFIKVDWTVTSDKRDKADIEPLTMGLDFVNKLNPVSYRWDMRSDYENQTPDGTHKKAKLSGGLLAQDVEILEREYGYKVEDETSILTTVNSDGNYGLTYSKFVPILINAVKELSAEIKALKGE